MSVVRLRLFSLLFEFNVIGNGIACNLYGTTVVLPELRRLLFQVVQDFYRAMHFSAKRGIAIVNCPSVCPSVCDVQVS